MAVAPAVAALVKALLRRLLLSTLGIGALQAHSASQVLVISGLGGEPQFEERFSDWGQKVALASATSTGDPARVQRLSGNEARRDVIEKKLQQLAGQLQPGDQFVLVLVGHGSFDGTEYRLNIPGEDLTGSQLLALLDRIPATVAQLVVVATSTSGAVAERWSKPHRVVITATRSGGERNATRFGGFWAQALTSNEADRDKDSVLTAQEAYEFTVRKVSDSYKADAAVMTEHAKLTGTEPSRFVVARLGPAAMFASDAQLIAMREQQAGIERRLAEVRAQKGQLSQDQYFDKLEPVLVELARLGQRVDARLAALGVSTGGAP
jgi:hypothetical protein